MRAATRRPHYQTASARAFRCALPTVVTSHLTNSATPAQRGAHNKIRRRDYESDRCRRSNPCLRAAERAPCGSPQLPAAT